MQTTIAPRERFDTSRIDQEARSACNDIWSLVSLIIAANEAGDTLDVGDRLDSIATTEDRIVALVRRLKHTPLAESAD